MNRSDQADRAQGQARLMALIFALRHLTVATVVLVVASSMAAGNILGAKERTALLLLFGLFYLLVGLVLYWIRVSRLEKLFLLLPWVLLAIPNGYAQLVALWVSGMLWGESFARPSTELDSQLPFRIVQLAVLTSPSVLLVTPALRIPLTVMLLVVASVAFAAGCWRWQDRLKDEMAKWD